MKSPGYREGGAKKGRKKKGVFLAKGEVNDLNKRTLALLNGSLLVTWGLN